MDISDTYNKLTVCEEDGLTSPYLSMLNLQSSGEDIYILSDLHLADGLEKDSKYSGTENFFYDEFFYRFIRHIVSPNKNSWLVINGDFIDFLRIIKLPQKPEDFELWRYYLHKIGINKSLKELQSSILRKEKEYGFKTHEYKSVWKIICAVQGHHLFFEALAEWINAGNKIVIVKGNHDSEWYWKGVRNVLRFVLSGLIVHLSEKGADEVLEKFIYPSLFFTDHTVTFNNSVYIEHGHLYDKYSHVQGPPLMPNKEELNLPFGAFLNRYLLNKLEVVYPFLDNVRPRNKILPLLFREHFSLGIKVFFRYIPFLFKIIPKRYFTYMFGKLLAFSIPLLILVLWGIISIWLSVKSGTVYIPEIKIWMITPLKTLILGILSFLFVKMIAFFQLEEKDNINEEAAKIIEAHPEYKFVIFGHTHNPEQFEYNESWYYNTGTWIPMVEINNAEIRMDKTFTFSHLTADKTGVYIPSALKRWNDDSSRFDNLVLINKKN
jgi:UDP-2,3-diacylglucosamine pyrophosphatase LpxH